MTNWRTIINLVLIGVIITEAITNSATENSTQHTNLVKWHESGEEFSAHNEVERKPRSLIDPGGLQTLQTGSIPVVSNIQTIQNIPIISNVQTVQQVPIISTVQQQPIGGAIGGGGLLGGAAGGIGGIGGGGIGGIGGAGIGGGFKRFHESYTIRARGFGGGLGFGKLGLGGKLGGLGGIGGIGGIGGLKGGFGGRYKARYTSSYGGGFAGAGLAGAGGLGGGVLG